MLQLKTTTIAALALAGGSTEPVSILGKRSTYDADDVGVRLQWPTQMDRPADDLHRLPRHHPGSPAGRAA